MIKNPKRNHNRTKSIRKINNQTAKRSGFYSGLGKTILLWFLGISLIPMMVVGYISYQNSGRHLVNWILGLKLQEGVNIMENISPSFISKLTEATNALAKDDFRFKYEFTQNESDE